MEIQDRDKLEHFLSALFFSNYNLPHLYQLKSLLHKFVIGDDFPGFEIVMLTNFIETIEEVFDEIMKSASDNSKIMEHRVYDANDCLQFFELILCYKYVPFAQDCEFFVNRIFYYAQCSNVDDVRVFSALSLLMDFKGLCKQIPDFILNAPSRTFAFDSQNCSCYQYEMTGDCYHVDDDGFEPESKLQCDC